MSRQKIDIFKKNNKVTQQFTDALNYAINRTDIQKFFEGNVKRQKISQQSIELGQEICCFLKKIIQKIDNSLIDEEWSSEEDDRNVESDETKVEKYQKRKKRLRNSGPSIVPTISSTKSNNKNKKSRGYNSGENDYSNETSSNKSSSDSSAESEPSSKSKKRQRISKELKLKVLRIYKSNENIKLKVLREKSGYKGIRSLQQVKSWEEQLIKQSYKSNPDAINNWVHGKCVEFVSKNGSKIITDEQLKQWALEAKEDLLPFDYSVMEFNPTNTWIKKFKQIFQPSEDEKTKVNKCITQEQLRGYLEPLDTELEFPDDEILNETATEENSTIIDDKPVDEDAERLEQILDANDDNAEMTIDQSAKSSSLDDANDDSAKQSSQNKSPAESPLDANDVVEMASKDKNPADSLVVNEIKEEQYDLEEYAAINLYVYNKYLEYKAAEKDFTDEDLKSWAVEANIICEFGTNKFVVSNQWLDKFKAAFCNTTSSPEIAGQLNGNTIDNDKEVQIIDLVDDDDEEDQNDNVGSNSGTEKTNVKIEIASVQSLSSTIFDK